ncbi:MAG: hypothetical protein UR68_C0003G0014 [Candidatus Roizmanbacteria bacterium GW2011_GWA2_35_19]|uniref:Peptidase S11 D-alanyl-D-alanine carboxypeptidase A N-terminal domain-containing protein n=2 Tax=Candidatus Roizmaniibacteriota TaxID=1752723 RepID=A0A0G0BWM4_9BACT|nr:MAG: hypothetical protein UR63_C0051G0002 [Candidatus Roizmanbacteria bacterium GW2011_GWC2_35_12]KKP73719.1 MAG: hypothetical protein UR68_C0003G0014 [Candidatus Roizmanbacteria bacterium GW2011_GWA2_35_19]
MRLKFYFLFTFFTLLFLFYPGDSYYFHIFAYNRSVFEKKEAANEIKVNPIPYLKNPTFYPLISAEGVYIADLPSFTPIFERNKDMRFLPASTTKILTALVVVDLFKPEQIIKVKNIGVDGQVMGLLEGEKITVENLLYGLLIQSGNDAAYAFSNEVGTEKFMTLIKKKANSLSMKNSNFRNPAGLDEAGQYSTPFDMALAARELLKNPYLSKIVSIKEITISDVDFKYFHKLTNVNKLLGEIAGLGGLKTGYTEAAGENLVSFYKKNNHQFIIVILKSLDRFIDTRNVVGWIEENVEYINPKF